MGICKLQTVSVHPYLCTLTTSTFKMGLDFREETRMKEVGKEIERGLGANIGSIFD